MDISLRIGALSRRTQCPAETIRYYEREGLLPQPVRTAGNYRLYGRASVRRLSFIRNCRSLDMTLDEIRQLLRVRDDPAGDCDAAHALLDEHIEHISARISELQRLAEDLTTLRRHCRPLGVDAECGILAELGGEERVGDAVAGPSTQQGPHVHGAHRR